MKRGNAILDVTVCHVHVSMCAPACEFVYVCSCESLQLDLGGRSAFVGWGCGKQRMASEGGAAVQLAKGAECVAAVQLAQSAEGGPAAQSAQRAKGGFANDENSEIVWVCLDGEMVWGRTWIDAAESEAADREPDLEADDRLRRIMRCEMVGPREAVLDVDYVECGCARDTRSWRQCCGASTVWLKQRSHATTGRSK